MSLKFESKSASNLIYWGFAGLCLILGSFILANITKMSDEYWFCKEFNSLGGYSGGVKHYFYAVKEMLRMHYEWDNSRLFNNIVILLIGCPIWVWRALSILGLYLFCSQSMKVAGIHTGQNGKLISFVALLVFTIPWHAHMLSFNYYSNYVWPSVFLLFGTYHFIKNDFTKIGAAILGLVIGLSHESFGFAFLGGAILTGIFDRKYATCNNIVALVAVITGLCWVCTVPAWSQPQHTLFKAGINNPLFFTVQLFYPILWALWWLFCIIGKKTRQAALRPLAIFTVGTLPLIIVGCVTYKSRAAFPCSVLSICASIDMFSQLYRSSWSKGWWRKLLMGLTAFAIIFHLSSVAAATVSVRKASDNFDNLCREAALKGVKNFYPFFDLPQTWDFHWFTLRMPSAHVFRFGHFAMTQRRKFWKFDDYMAVPSHLEYFQPDSLNRVPSDENIFIVNGDLVAPANFPKGKMYLTIDYGCRKETELCWAAPFTTKSGQDFTYIFINRSIFGCYLGDPVDISGY